MIKCLTKRFTFEIYLRKVGLKSLGLYFSLNLFGLTGVSFSSGKQTSKYIINLPHVQLSLPFFYESTGTEMYFRDIKYPNSRHAEYWQDQAYPVMLVIR